MLYLLFELDAGRYAIEASRVTEVLPLVEITRVPQAPPEVAGVCDRRGTPVPVIDLCQLLLGRPAARRLSTRILIVDYAGVGRARQLGLVAEKATRIAQLDADAFLPSGIRNSRAPYLGDVVGGPQGLIQRIDVDAILPDAVRDLLSAAGVR
jgi:chemotaxis-related protein WspB